MARTITHEGYTILSTPHETDGDKWRLHIRISQKDHQGVRTSEFPAQVLCASELISMGLPLANASSMGR